MGRSRGDHLAGGGPGRNFATNARGNTAAPPNASLIRFTKTASAASTIHPPPFGVSGPINAAGMRLRCPRRRRDNDARWIGNFVGHGTGSAALQPGRDGAQEATPKMAAQRPLQISIPAAMPARPSSTWPGQRWRSRRLAPKIVSQQGPLDAWSIEIAKNANPIRQARQHRLTALPASRPPLPKLCGLATSKPTVAIGRAHLKCWVITIRVPKAGTSATKDDQHRSANGWRIV